MRLEHKPSAVVLHTRGVEPSVAAAAAAAAYEVGGRYTGVHVLPGKDVVELTVLEANKGSALVDLARQTCSDATLYLGDDVTDERAFAALDPASGDLTETKLASTASNRPLRAEGGDITPAGERRNLFRTLNSSLPSAVLTIRIARNNSWVRSILMEDDGWIRWCGSDLRICRSPKPPLRARGA